MSINELRQTYHQRICEDIVRIRRSKKAGEYPNFADGDNASSVRIAGGIMQRLGCDGKSGPKADQAAESAFAELTRDFLEEAFGLLHHLRPGRWLYWTEQTDISGFDQYHHLAQLAKQISTHPELAAVLGTDYLITPDIVIGRYPVDDVEINRGAHVVEADDGLARLTPFRESNGEDSRPILHASISCKWTLRSDRAQNTRTEALNLIRNRKGRLPHIVAVTAEPLPTRLAALALGTGDLDCIYHFALPELEAAIRESDNQDQLEILLTMLDGHRLRDISDLPFDLAV